MTLRMSCGADSGRSRMAKIRLTDYLKSKRKKEEVLFESEEDILRRARRKMEADQFIISPAYRIENFRQAEKLVSQIPDYEEAGELKEQFRSKRQKAELEKKEWDLRRAHLHFDQARTEDEFKKVQEEFSLLGDYGDAAHFCEQAGELFGITTSALRLSVRSFPSAAQLSGCLCARRRLSHPRR